MSKPDDIPQDVWNAAYDEALLYVQWLVPCPEEYVQAEYVLAQTIARAILAERERCAKVCEAAAEQFLSPEYATGQPLSSFAERFACDTCAEGIRSGV